MHSRLNLWVTRLYMFSLLIPAKHTKEGIEKDIFYRINDAVSAAYKHLMFYLGDDEEYKYKLDLGPPARLYKNKNKKEDDEYILPTKFNNWLKTVPEKYLQAYRKQYYG